MKRTNIRDKKFSFIRFNYWIVLFFIVITDIPLVSAQELVVKINNRTGRTLRSFYVGDKKIGRIEVGKSTDSLNFTKFLFDSHFPYEKLKGRRNLRTLRQYNWAYFCATSRNVKTSGYYEFDLWVIRRKNYKRYLFLSNHTDFGTPFLPFNECRVIYGK